MAAKEKRCPMCGAVVTGNSRKVYCSSSCKYRLKDNNKPNNKRTKIFQSKMNYDNVLNYVI